MNEHVRYEENIGAFLLGALEDGEREAFESHLSGCVVCREEVDRLAPAAAALPRSVEPVRPPAGLKAALMETVEREARERRPTPERRTLGERLRSLLPTPGVARPALVWVGACFVLLAGGLAGFAVSGQLQDEGEGSRTLAANVNQERMPRAGGSLKVFDSGDGAILRMRRVPRPPSGQVYQAWVMRDGDVVPQPTFEVSRDGTASAPITEDLEDADAVLVTREARGGAGAPSEQPVVSVKL